MRPRSISARFSATPEELEHLLALLERERNTLIERGESETTPLGRALWASTDSVRAALRAHTARKEGRVDLARLNSRLKNS